MQEETFIICSFLLLKCLFPFFAVCAPLYLLKHHYYVFSKWLWSLTNYLEYMLTDMYVESSDNKCYLYYSFLHVVTVLTQA